MRRKLWTRLLRPIVCRKYAVCLWWFCLRQKLRGTLATLDLWSFHLHAESTQCVCDDFVPVMILLVCRNCVAHLCGTIVTLARPVIVSFARRKYAVCLWWFCACDDFVCAQKLCGTFATLDLWLFHLYAESTQCVCDDFVPVVILLSRRDCAAHLRRRTCDCFICTQKVCSVFVIILCLWWFCLCAEIVQHICDVGLVIVSFARRKCATHYKVCQTKVLWMAA